MNPAPEKPILGIAKRIVAEAALTASTSPGATGFPLRSAARLGHLVGVTNDDLVSRAAAVVNPRHIGGRLIGDVGAALITDRGNVYVGVCIDTGSGTGFCAEHSAIAAMVTAGEFNIATIVAVWKDAHGAIVILPPCGRCREFIRQISQANLDTAVILSAGVIKLRELLPYHEWPT
jgi:cytidine deaminase